MVEVVVVNRGEVDCIFVFAFVSILEKEEKTTYLSLDKVTHVLITE